MPGGPQQGMDPAQQQAMMRMQQQQQQQNNKEGSPELRQLPNQKRK